ASAERGRGANRDRQDAPSAASAAIQVEAGGVDRDAGQTVDRGDGRAAAYRTRSAGDDGRRRPAADQDAERRNAETPDVQEGDDDNDDVRAADHDDDCAG